MEKKTILIKNETDIINSFKINSFHFYESNSAVPYFGFTNFLINILLNIKEYYLTQYGSILEPDERNLKFYKVKQSHKYFVLTNPSKITFLLPIEFYSLYINLMHTYYVNEKNSFPTYSVSLFFTELYSFSEINKKNLKVLYYGCGEKN